VIVIVALTLSSGAFAQRGGRGGGGGGFFGQIVEGPNPAYNGRFTFTRIRYNGGLGGGFRRGGMSSAWNHDYPQADMHLPLILNALTALSPNVNVSNIFSLEEPEIFRNPILYMWEPGYWSTTDAEAENLRAFMLKGGFIMFDDFEDDQWINFEAQFRRALPEAQFFKLAHDHPIFHTFFDMQTINVPHPTVNVVPAYYAVYEDNDPRKRMMALACHNSDIAEYWEWSDRGYFPVDTTNDAYKIGVNYFMYAATH
jgi:hypothetical protein